MAIKGIKRNFPPLEILTADEMEAIDRAILQVLWETGVTFHHEEALKVFEQSGCKVDRDNDRVRFPPWLVKECLAKCPSSFRVKARNPDNDLILEGAGDTTYIKLGVGMTGLDLDTWTPQAPSRKEFYDYMKVVDGLPYYHIMSCFPFFGFKGVPECMLLVESNASKIRCSSKPQQEGGVLDNHLWNIKMAKAVGMDLLLLLNPAAPLTYYRETAQLIFDYVAEDQPFHCVTGPVAGSTGPATVVGSIITQSAETMAGMCLAQLLHPGHRVWAGNMMMVQNMRTGSPSFSAIENALGEVIHVQMWRHYKIPCWCSDSAWGDSKQIDYQAGYELNMPAMIQALAGASAMFFGGSLTAELTGHWYKAVMDHDVAGMIARFLSGVTVNDDTMAVDLIDKVGPIPGYFLNTAHSREWWKKEQFVPKTVDQDSFEIWAQKGKKTALDHAKEVFDKILATHQPEPLTPEQEKAVEGILQEARQHYREQGQISDSEWAAYMKTIESPTYPWA
jgi:trimethylamine--corrinoid protein Co-methyltransferase